MTVIANKTPAASGIPGIEHVTLAGGSDGLHDISLWQQSIAPGAATPPHRHDCEEVMLCGGGEGELHIDDRVERFGAGTTVVIPRNADHQIFSVGSEARGYLPCSARRPWSRISRTDPGLICHGAHEVHCGCYIAAV